MKHLQLSTDDPIRLRKDDWYFPTIAWGVPITKIKQSQRDLVNDECESLNAGADSRKLACIVQ